MSGIVLIDAVGIDVPGHPVADAFSLSLEGTGHMPQLETPDQVLQVIRGMGAADFSAQRELGVR